MSDPLGTGDAHIDLPAPKSAFADLPAPKNPPPGILPGGEPLVLDENLPAPVRRGGGRSIDNLPAPRQAPVASPPPPPPLPQARVSQAQNLPDNLPAPRQRAELPDLLAPIAGPPPLPNLPDNLPAPKQPLGGPSNLPAPKGFFDDAVAPKQDPFGGAGGVGNLPAPKGFFEDGVAPRQPGAQGGAGNLPAPKGFFEDGVRPANEPFGGQPGALPAPKGFFDDGVAPKTAGGIGGPENLPAPKGIFDDLAPPQTMGGAAAPVGLDLGEPLDLGAPLGDAGSMPIDLGAPIGSPGESLELGNPLPPAGGPMGMDLDGLELSGPGGPLGGEAPPLDLGAPQRPFGLDDLELEAPAPGGAPPSGSAFEGVALPGAGPQLAAPQPVAPPSSDGVVSFSKPSESAVAAGQQGFVRRRPQNDDAGPLELDDSPLPADQQAQARRTLAAERRSGVSVAPPPATSKKKRGLMLAGVFGIVALGAGGFFGYTKYSESKATQKAVESGIKEARKHLVADRPGHWGAAVNAASRALAKDKKNVAALALAAQAHFASSIDTGINGAAQIGLGKKLMARLRQAAAKGPDVQKADGLQALVERRGPDALKHFAAAKQANPRDGSIDLFFGWAHLEVRDFAAAESAFNAALKSSPGNVSALYGLARAQQGAGKVAEARASYVQAIEKSRERYKVDHVGALVGAAELAEVERFTDRENQYLEILARGDLEKADPRAISRAWTLAGEEALRAGRLQEANQRFVKALELDGTNGAAVVGEGKTLLAMRQYPEARERLSRVLKVDAGNLDATLALAEVALREENLTESKQLLANILEREPPVENKQTLSEAHRILAGALSLEPDSDAQAESEYREAVKLANEQNIRAALDLANFYVSRKRAEEAKAVLEPIRARAKSDPGIGVNLGVAYLGADDPVSAEATLRDALALRPGDSEARYQLGQSLLAQKRTDEGLAAIKAAYDANKSREDIGLALAVAYEDNKRLSDAAALYETLLAGEQPSLNVKGRAGRYFARHGAGARAIALGEEILAESRNNPAGLFLLGEKHFAANEFDKAQRAYLDASSLDKQAQYLEGAGRAAEKQRSFDDALRHFGDALALEADYLSALSGQARIFIGRRAFDKAIAALDKSISINPKDAWSHFARGEALVELGKLKEGVGSLTRAIKIEPSMASAHYRLGRAYFDLDKARKAAQSLERATNKAVGTEEWLTEAYRVLGYAHRMSSNRRAAIKAFRTYLERNPKKGPQRSDARRELLFLEGGGR